MSEYSPRLTSSLKHGGSKSNAMDAGPSTATSARNRTINRTINTL